jgi:hypothetical protein
MARFLLAKVQLDMVLHVEFSPLMARQLEHLPKSPSESYMKGLERIQAADELSKKAALHTLAWIYHAKRKLAIGELLDAIAWTTKTTDCLNLESIHLMDMCRGLAFHDKSSDIVQFIHGTVETFLEQCFNPERAKDTAVVKDESHASIINDLRPHFLSNIDLAKACLTYLSLDIFDSPCPSDERSLQERVLKYKLSVYAAKHWADHIRGAAETNSDIWDSILTAFRQVGKRQSMEQMKRLLWGFETSTGKTLLHVLVEHQLLLIFRYPSSDDTPNTNDRYVLCSLPS